jgi:hypothetical protein
VKVVWPVPPPPTVRVPEVEGLKVKVPPELVTVRVEVRPLVVEVVVARVMAPLCAVPPPFCAMEVTPVPEVSTQELLMAKHPPPVRLSPPEEEKVEVPVVKFPTPCTESMEPGEVVPMPTEPPTVARKTEDVAVSSLVVALVKFCRAVHQLELPVLSVRVPPAPPTRAPRVPEYESEVLVEREEVATPATPVPPVE